MSFPLKKLIFSIFYNISLFFILIIGIQNSTNDSKVFLISSETVRLPVSFIVGLSFISGSLAGSLINFNFLEKKDI